MMNNIQQGTLGNTLVLHEFKKNPIDIAGWFYFIEALFLKHGLNPSKMGGKGSKTITFARGKKQQEKKHFTDLQKGMWVAALPVDGGVEMLDFLYVAHLSNSSPRGTCVLCWDDQIIPFDPAYFDSLAHDLSVFLEPTYGYGYQREFKYGPSLYPFGVIAGLEYGMPERKYITEWGNAYDCLDGRYRTGDLRDIYPLNFLSSPHLERDVYGQSLKEWIASSPAHGEVKSLNNSLWSWFIQDDQISLVREALRGTGILLCV